MRRYISSTLSICILTSCIIIMYSFSCGSGQFCCSIDLSLFCFFFFFFSAVFLDYSEDVLHRPCLSVSCIIVVTYKLVSWRNYLAIPRFMTLSSLCQFSFWWLSDRKCRLIEICEILSFEHGYVRNVKLIGLIDRALWDYCCRVSYFDLLTLRSICSIGLMKG